MATPNILSDLEEFVAEQLMGVYSVTYVIVEDVDEDDRRVEVSLKSDPEAFVDNVPIASPFARDGAGMIVPIEEGDEGLLLHPREPIDKQIQQRGHREAADRRFVLEAAVFMPMLWLDEDDVPDHEEGEFLLVVHPDGWVLRMPEDGSVVLEHPDGSSIELGESGDITVEAENVTVEADQVTLGNPGSAAAVLTEDASLTDSEGGSVSIDDPGSEDVQVS